MISRMIDSLADRHPSFSEHLRSRLTTVFSVSLAENAALCILAGISAGAFASSGNDILRYTVFAVSALMLIFAAFSAGFLRQWLDIALSAVYFMRPYVFVLVPGSFEEARADEVQRMLSELFGTVLLRPVTLISAKDPQMVSIVFFLVSMALFFAGMHIRSAAKRSDFYCRARLAQLNNGYMKGRNENESK
ncbi:MAG: hypothetical protein J6X60_04255 [Ruminiclostridium sp.]|nr:hypothetical protein [Ruminiclostridium sp.]